MYRKQIILFRSISAILLLFVIFASVSSAPDSTTFSGRRECLAKTDTATTIKKNIVLEKNTISEKKPGAASPVVSTVNRKKDNKTLLPPYSGSKNQKKKP